MHVEIDVLADEPSEERLRVAHELVQIDHLGTEKLPPAERQQLPRHRRRRFGRLPNLLGGFAAVWVEHLAQQQINIAENDGQQIVEIVRDAAGKTPDRFHLLRLTQLLVAVGQLLRPFDDTRFQIALGVVQRPHGLAKVRIGLAELLRRQLERALEHRAIGVGLKVGCVHHLDEPVHLRRQVRHRCERPLNLAA